ncbi:MAG: YggT family protein [Cardiobacteriaceae bacterium]|nr:YggT family protein [Cardiobacteriaceae bacterium]
MSLVLGIFGWLIKLLVMVLCIRFHTRGYFLPSNELVKGLRRLTDALVLPFERLLPTKRFDRAALAAGLVVCLLHSLILLWNLNSFSLLALLRIGVGNFLLSWSDMIFYCIIIGVIASWLQTPAHNPVMQVVHSCSQWYLAPIRKWIPSLPMPKSLGGGLALDLSPLVAMLGLFLFQTMVIGSILKMFM